MEIAKPTDGDRGWFRSLVPTDPRVEVKPMFGNLGAFVNGNMFMGLFGPDVGIRLPATEAEELLALGGGPFGPTGRPMRGYVSLPTAWRGKAAKNTAWVTRALDHVGGLPPKTPKTPKAATARKRRATGK